MNAKHTNKTLATLLAFLLGTLGFHRFYVYGRKDIGGWTHILSLPISGLIWLACNEIQPFFAASALLVSALAGFVEALVTGLTPDEKWDALHNSVSGTHSESGWVLALILVLTLGIGAAILIFAIARLADLLFTGGAYG